MHDLENIELRDVQPLRDVGNLDTLIAHHCAVQQDPNGMACGLCQSHGLPSLTSLQDCVGSNSTPPVMDLKHLCECFSRPSKIEITQHGNGSSRGAVPLGGPRPSECWRKSRLAIGSSSTRTIPSAASEQLEADT